MNLLSEVGREENKDRMVSEKTNDERVFFSTDSSGNGSGKGMGS